MQSSTISDSLLLRLVLFVWANFLGTRGRFLFTEERDRIPLSQHLSCRQASTHDATGNTIRYHVLPGKVQASDLGDLGTEPQEVRPGFEALHIEVEPVKGPSFAA